MMTMASFVADQETVIKLESEVEVEVEKEKQPIVFPTNESSENLLKILHIVTFSLTFLFF